MSKKGTFCYKVSWEVAFKEFLVLKGVVQLAVGHAATLKPAVKHLLHSVQVPLALLAGNYDMVYEVPVQICDLQASKAVSCVTCHNDQTENVLKMSVMNGT